MLNFYRAKKWPQNFQNNYPEYIRKNPGHPGQSGVDVMITIFCDFWLFSAKKLAFSQKPML
jgi:hypothetical protein